MDLERLGVNRLYDEIKAGRSVLPLFKDFLRDYGTPTVSLLAGAISGSLVLIRDAENSGVTFDMQGQSIGTSASLAVEFNRAFAGHDLMKLCDLLKVLASSVDGLKAAGLVSFDEPVEQSAEAAPLRVEIVSQPARETVTEVARDSSGSITSSTQIERDAQMTNRKE